MKRDRRAFCYSLVGDSLLIPYIVGGSLSGLAVNYYRGFPPGVSYLIELDATLMVHDGIVRRTSPPPHLFQQKPWGYYGIRGVMRFGLVFFGAKGLPIR